MLASKIRALVILGIVFMLGGMVWIGYFTR